MVAEGSMQDIPGAQGIEREHLGNGDLALLSLMTIDNRLCAMDDGRSSYADFLQKVKHIAARLAADLRKVRDPMTGAPVIANVYVTEETYSATDLETVPDLIVGYARGYRCSSSSALGVPHPEVLDDNTGTWSGDHCIDREAVPGVLFSNRPLRVERPALPDIAATALTTFGREGPREMIGKTIW